MACLLEKYANLFIDGLKKGEIEPGKLSDMTSEQRRDFLSKYVGKENSKFVNTMFESKLLLKNQKVGMISWAKAVAGLKEKTKTDILSKIEKLDRALNPGEQQQFLSDIVEQRLGIEISPEEARTITDLTAKMKEIYDARLTDENKTYWRYKKQLVDFVKEHTPSDITGTGVERAKKIAAESLSVLRAIKTGFDFSASLRQGLSYFGTKQWTGAFQRMFGYAKSQVNLDELEINMMSHKYSDQALSVKRDLGLTLLGETFTQREEAFASKYIKKIPLLKGSERAYEGFLNDVRFNRFVDILENLDKAGNGITDNPKAMKDLAQVIAAATGRGTLGSAEGAARSLATVIFSPRWIASRIQMIMNPIMKSGVARSEAAKALARSAGVAVAIISLAKMMGADVETDSTSSDFGKIKIGNTRFDVSGGLLPYIVFISRQIQGKTKSSITHKISKLNTGKFGSRNRWDLATDFIESKASPLFGAIRDSLKGQTFKREKIDFINNPKQATALVADNLVTPLLASDAIDAFREASGETKLIMGTTAAAASLFGVGVSSY